MVTPDPGERYRFLFVSLLNQGHGWRIAVESDDRSTTQMLLDNGYQITYPPEFDKDIVVGLKDDDLVGVMDLSIIFPGTFLDSLGSESHSFWAINLNRHSKKSK